MARFRSASMFVAAGCLLAAGMVGCSGDEGAPSVLLIPRTESIDMDFMLTREVGVMVTMLEEAGIQTVVALPEGQALEGRTQSLQADLTLADVVVSDYDGILLPCMAASYERNDLTVEIVREAVAAGLPVAAQYGSVNMLAEAGALDGREYAAGEVLRAEDATYMGYGVVQDGPVITSGTCPKSGAMYGRPDGTPEVTQALIDALE